MTKQEQIMFVMKRKQMKKINKACQMLLDDKHDWYPGTNFKQSLLDTLLCAAKTKKLTNPLERLAESLIDILENR